MSQTTDISLQLTEHPRRSCDWPDFQVRLAAIFSSFNWSEDVRAGQSYRYDTNCRSKFQLSTL